MSVLQEFKKFVMRGNIVDMAVGVIIGGAFGKIVTSLVNDIIMPLVGIALGNIDVTLLEYKIGEASIKYGLFLQNILNFIIVAFCIFMIIKLINRMHSAPKPAPAPPKPTNEELLLKDIRDFLEKIEKK